MWCSNTDGKCSTSVHGKKIDSNCSLAYHRLRLNNAATPTAMNPSTNLPVRCKVLDCRKWHCTYAMPHHMAQAHPGVSHDYAGCSEEEKTKVLQAFDNFRAPLPPKAKLAVPPALPTVLPAVVSLGQTRVVVVVAVLVAAAPPPMPPPVRVHPPAGVPRQALVAMCHWNPCLMGRQPAGSQDRKRLGQRSVLAPRVPARWLEAMLEAPPLPSLLYIYVSGL